MLGFHHHHHHHGHDHHEHNHHGQHHHGHHHNGHHHHGHHHGHSSNKAALLVSFVIISLFMVVEAAGGIFSNSLALLSDAGHMFSDASALLLSLLATYFSGKTPSPTKTFGFYRYEILAALLNGVALVVVSLIIFWEAYQRLISPPEVASLTMVGIAVAGLLSNIAVALILMRGDYKENLNLRSAFLHVLGDLLGSIGAIVAGILMWLFGWYIADPIISIFVGVMILLSAWRVTSESIHILMEGVPASIDTGAVSQKLTNIPGVINAHDLHIWTLTSGFHSLTCHLYVEDDVSSYSVLHEALRLLKEEFHITHATIQIENSRLTHNELHCHQEAHCQGPE